MQQVPNAHVSTHVATPLELDTHPIDVLADVAHDLSALHAPPTVPAVPVGGASAHTFILLHCAHNIYLQRNYFILFYFEKI